MQKQELLIKLYSDHPLMKKFVTSSQIQGEIEQFLKWYQACLDHPAPHEDMESNIPKISKETEEIYQFLLKIKFI